MNLFDNNEKRIDVTLDKIGVAESFSHKENKNPNAGSGETRLYLGSSKNSNVASFIDFNDDHVTYANKKNYSTCDKPFFLLKPNLLDYHKRLKDYYSSIHMNDLYEERLEAIDRMPMYSKLQVFNQNGTSDRDRVYIGSTDDIWTFFRKIAMPRVSYIRIDRCIEDNETFYVLSLFNKDDIDNGEKQWGEIDVIKQVEKTLEKEVEDNVLLSDTEKKEIILARKGQGKFRKRVLENMSTCLFTGISQQDLLIASHCKPWSNCETAVERLDGYNGLALTPTYDKLFDKGYICFSDKGELLISKELDDAVVKELGLIEGKKYFEENELEFRRIYLGYHRKLVFRN